MPKFYIARITNVGGKYGLVSDVIFYDIGSVLASEMKKREVIVVRIFENTCEKKFYYVVKNGLFCLFAEHII